MQLPDGAAMHVQRTACISCSNAATQADHMPSCIYLAPHCCVDSCHHTLHEHLLFCAVDVDVLYVALCAPPRQPTMHCHHPFPMLRLRWTSCDAATWLCLPPAPAHTNP